ncbi:hypothetical protein SODG_001826 [Sodalis praecaptivus]|nr:hypothetical protein NVIRENTERO_01589 [Sodalis praecaptivus]
MPISPYLDAKRQAFSALNKRLAFHQGLADGADACQAQAVYAVISFLHGRDTYPGLSPRCCSEAQPALIKQVTRVGSPRLALENVLKKIIPSWGRIFSR